MDKVDIRQVIDAFNQYSKLPFKFDRNRANFSNVTLDLCDVDWSENTFETSQTNHNFSRTVKVSDQMGSSSKLTVSPNAVPGSTITISTGGVLGFGQPNVTARLPIPPRLRSYIMEIDLTKDEQVVCMPEGLTPRKYLEFRGAAKASVTSKNVVYQGSFKARAQLTGPVTFVTQQGGRQQGYIEEYARGAAKHITKPFRFEQNALCWTVTGTADLLLESVEVVKAR